MIIFRLVERALSGQKVKCGRRVEEQSRDCCPSPAEALCPRPVPDAGEISSNVKLHHNASGILSKVETQYD